MVKIRKYYYSLVACLGCGLFSLIHLKDSKIAGLPATVDSLQAPKKGNGTSHETFAHAIAEFRSRTSFIDRSKILAEQQRIEAARRQYESFEDETPRVDIVHDEYGMSWRRLSYRDGRIRYELPDP